jgi:hypothetical protein
MKIGIVTAIWQRPEVWDMFKQGVRRLRNQYVDVEVEVCAAGSEGIKSQNRCKEKWIHYVEIDNKPLGRKMNAASLLAKEKGYDYCLLVGSDDIICNKLFDLYLDEAEKGTDYTYLMDGYFFDTTTKLALYWGGYIDNRKGDPLGAGRLLSKNLLDKLNWKMWYDVKLSGMLDSAMDEKMKQIDYTEKAIWLKDNDCMLLDIKSTTNMTRFQRWQNSNFIPLEVISKYLPKFEFNKLYSYVK